MSHKLRTQPYGSEFSSIRKIKVSIELLEVARIRQVTDAEARAFGIVRDQSARLEGLCSHIFGHRVKSLAIGSVVIIPKWTLRANQRRRIYRPSEIDDTSICCRPTAPISRMRAFPSLSSKLRNRNWQAWQ